MKLKTSSALASPSPTLRVAQSFYDAIARGDVAGALAVFHPSLAWTEAEGFPYYRGTWRTPQEVVARLVVPLARDCCPSLEYQLHPRL